MVTAVEGEMWDYIELVEVFLDVRIMFVPRFKHIRYGMQYSVERGVNYV